MTQMTQATETNTPSKIETLINAIQTAEGRGRELKAAIRAQEIEALPNFQAITAWRAEIDVIENRQLPTLRGEYTRAVADSREIELAGLKAQLAQLGERVGKASAERGATRKELDDALHTARRVNTGAAWLEVVRIGRRLAPILDEAAAIEAEAKQVSGRIFDMEREREAGRW